jgi:hypothetical protein
MLATALPSVLVSLKGESGGLPGTSGVLHCGQNVNPGVTLAPQVKQAKPGLSEDRLESSEPKVPHILQKSNSSVYQSKLRLQKLGNRVSAELSTAANAGHRKKPKSQSPTRAAHAASPQIQAFCGTHRNAARVGNDM